MQLLEGWKNVAYHLAVSDRTAQTWALKQGLPIRYRGGRVVAEPTEIDRWKASISENRRKNGRKAITVRLPAAEYARVKMCLSRDEPTVQDFVVHAVAAYINTHATP